MLTLSSAADDRETPLRALQDVVAVFELLFPTTTPLRIYDPYYCNGAIKTRLQECGSFVVHNDAVDCYVAQKNNEVPEYDVLLTNPPYSGNHVQRALQYAISCNKPWALLLPSHVLQRPWFVAATTKHAIFYLAPHERYSFEMPSSSPATSNTQHVPFVTMWFIGGISTQQQEELHTFNRSGCTLAARLSDLPRRIRKLLPFLENRAERKRKDRDKDKLVKSNTKIVADNSKKRQKCK